MGVVGGGLGGGGVPKEKPQNPPLALTQSDCRKNSLLPRSTNPMFPSHRSPTSPRFPADSLRQARVLDELGSGSVMASATSCEMKDAIASAAGLLFRPPEMPHTFGHRSGSPMNAYFRSRPL